MKNTSKTPCIVTVTDGISPTSMPYNEFVLYRLAKYPHERQIIIQLFEKGIDGDFEIPANVGFFSLGMNVASIWRTIKAIEREYDVKAYHIHEGKSVILFSVATLLTRRRKVVYTLHSTYRNYPLHNKIFSFCASLLANYVICVSETSYKYYPSVLKFFRGGKATSIQNGVDEDRINGVTITKNADKDVFTLIYVARLVSLKRHYFLIDILRELPNVRLVLIGKGPLDEELKLLAKQNGVASQVEFRGAVPREKVYESLMNANLYVSTSSYEGLPIGVLEAMGCGTPCLVSDIEQHCEIARKCPSLFTLPLESGLWIEKIKELQCMDKRTLLRIGEQSRMQVFKHFTLRQMHENYNKIYNSL